MLGEFKKFILKGNVVDLATGVIIGAAFAKIVDGFTKGIVQPLLNMMGGDPNVALSIGPFDVGVVINAIISFLITAAVIFFLIVKPANALMAMTKEKEAAAPPPAPTVDQVLLTEIRDLLAAK
ncbi:MAG: large conductance mechanosensitive channel protein MscL [Planctomycetaceae bacterium]